MEKLRPEKPLRLMAKLENRLNPFCSAIAYRAIGIAIIIKALRKNSCRDFWAKMFRKTMKNNKKVMWAMSPSERG